MKFNISGNDLTIFNIKYKIFNVKFNNNELNI